VDDRSWHGEGRRHRPWHRLGDLGDAAPVHEKARAEMLAGDARQAIKEEAPLDRVRLLTGEL
jgi:molecular chaperone DnaK